MCEEQGYDEMHTCSAWYTALAHRGHSTLPPKMFGPPPPVIAGRIPVGVCASGRVGDMDLDCMTPPVGVEGMGRVVPPVGVEKMGLMGVLPVEVGVSGDWPAVSAPKVRLVGEGGPARSAAKPVLPFLIALGERGAGKRDVMPGLERYSKLYVLFKVRAGMAEATPERVGEDDRGGDGEAEGASRSILVGFGPFVPASVSKGSVGLGRVPGSAGGSKSSTSGFSISAVSVTGDTVRGGVRGGSFCGWEADGFENRSANVPMEGGGDTGCALCDDGLPGGDDGARFWCLKSEMVEQVV
jgi:hypothetical protein